MPELSNFIEYHKSIAKEMNATKDRIRQLIGSHHWQTDGEHKEAVLRKILRSQLPELVRVGRGFVCFQNEPSSQIDILITGSDKPALFKDGELRIVTPDAVEAIVEVKTSLNSRYDFRQTIKKLSQNIEKIRSYGNASCRAGLFVYQNHDSDLPLGDKAILEILQSVINDQLNRVINWISFGPDRFVRYWQQGTDVNSLFPGPVWNSYELVEGLGHAYFLSNVIYDIWQEHGPERGIMQYAWFPIEGGKERYRRWCISLGAGEARKFDW